MNASRLDLDWIWTQFGQDLSPPNRGGLEKNSDRTQANVNAVGLASDWKWTGCHGEVVVHCTSGQQCAQVKQKFKYYMFAGSLEPGQSCVNATQSPIPGQSQSKSRLSPLV